MGTPYVGEIRAVGFNFAPVDWALCNGQLLSIADNPALFQLLGTTYGGDGVQNFGLPNLQGRVAVHQGQGPGLSNYVQGQMGGAESVTLASGQMPVHGHGLAGTSTGATAQNPSTSVVPAALPTGELLYATGTGTNLNPDSISQVGGNQPHENRQPFQVINYIIALNGIFPSQS